MTPTFGAHGTTSVDASGNVLYTPVANYTGTDTFTYTLTNNGLTSAPITVTVTVQPETAVMTLTKAANNTVANAGDVINYTLIAKNTGNVPLTNITITDNGADAGSVSPATIASLAVGASATITAKQTVTAADVTAGRYSNQASSTGYDPQNNQVTVPGSDDPNTPAANDPTVSIISQPGVISLTKSGAFSANLITYTFTIKNTGNVTLTNVTLTDAKVGLSAAPVTIPAGGLTAGSSVTYNAVYTLTQADKDAGSVTNNATVSSKDPAGNTITAPGSATTTVSPSPVANNDVSVVNFNQPKAISVLANDTPDNTNFDVTSVTIVTQPAHGTVTANSDGTVTYTPANNYTGGDSFTYKVKDSYGYSSNVATVSVTVTNYVASMSLTKTANNGAANAGDVINYTIVATNTGNVVLSNVVLTDAGADAGSISPASVATLAVGASTTFTAFHTVTAADVAAGTYSNQASVNAKDPNNNTVNTPKSDDPTTPAVNDPTTTIITQPGTISLTKAGVFNGNIITYTFTIKNTGNVTLTNVALTDSKLGLSGVTVPIPSGGLTAGSTVTYSAAYTLTQADKDAGSITNNASVSSKDPNGNTVSNTASVTTTYPSSPVASNDVSTTPFNQPVVIPVLSNDDPKNSTFNNSTLQIVTTPSHGTAVSNGDGTVTYTPAANYVGSDSFTYRIKDAFGYYTNVATVSVTVNNFNAAMTVTKVANNGASAVGNIINFTITVTNTGNVALTNVTITDANADAGSISPSTISTLAVGASATVTVKHTVTAADVTAGSVSNQASVTATDPTNNPVGPVRSDNPNTPTPNDPTVVALTAPGTISLTKAGVFSGNTITYTFTIKNTGPVTLTNVTLTDSKVALTNNPVTIPSGGLTPGSSVTYTSVYTLTQSDKDVGTVTNNASVNSTDPNGNSVTATASVTVSVPVSPTATADAATTGLGVPVVIPVLKNDNPGNSTFNPATVTVVTPPSHGTATVNSDGTITYTPAAGFTGQDVFTYKVQDAYGYSTNIAPVTVNVVAPGTISLTKSGVVSGNTIVYTFIVKNTGGVTLNNILITDTKLGIANAIVSIPSGGLVPGATATYSSTYTLTQADRDAGTVVNNASVTSKDVNGNTVTSTASVSISVPLSPVAVNISQVVLINQPVTIPVAKDGNPGNSTFDPTSIQITSPPAHGKVVINSDGTITYIPDPGYTGPDAFSYRLKDVNGYYTNVATVTIDDTATAQLKIPNLFTPNGDGINDYFEIRGLSNYPNNELIIVNRWGNEVFRQTNYQNKWDGTGLNEGTYYYLLYIRKADGSIFQVLKGYTTLLRTLKK